MDKGQGRWSYLGILFLLIISALILTARVSYLYLADAQRFPINTVKITASYHRISRQQLEGILGDTLSGNSFFTLPVQKLRSALKSLPWTKSIYVERVWPDTLKINLVENNPIATWNDAMLLEDGKVFNSDSENVEPMLPHLRGPRNQQQEVLQVYQKLSKILSMNDFYITTLEKRDNQAWEVTLANGVQLHLGKQDIDLKVERFCKAYPAVFSGKLDRLVSVDLRYPRGMAVQWRSALQ